MKELPENNKNSISNSYTCNESVIKDNDAISIFMDKDEITKNKENENENKENQTNT